MERPASRGGGILGSTGIGKAPTSSGILAPDRPNTASRGGGGMPPSTASGPGGRPPGTAQRGGAPPSSAYKRLGTAQGRPGTGSQGAAGAGGKGASNVPTVDARPITQHGVSGMKTAVAGGGGGRKVLDKNFFMSELRTKRAEIATVTQSMRDEQEALEKKQGQFMTMEKRGNDLMKEVKIMQEALADYNTVLDKVGSQTPIYAINAEHAQLKERNEGQRRRVDDVLTERLNIEQKAKQAENRIQEMQQAMENRINSMPPSQRQQYQDLMVEQAGLQQESKRFEEAIDELDKSLATQEGELARNPLKQRSLQLQEQIRLLTEKKYELQQEEEKSKMSPDEQREQLMAKIKRDNQEVEATTQQVRETQEQIKRMEAKIGSVQGNGNSFNAAEEAAKREKYEELVAKERDLNNFMDSFPKRRADKLEETRSKQDAIVNLLEKITKLQGLAGSALPTQKKFREMQDELEYKKQQLENTQQTQERLKEELMMRRTELDKIDTLDDKIRGELAQLAEKSEQMRAEIGTFSNIGDMQAKAEETRVRLEKARASLAKRRELLRATVSDKALKLQAKKAQLQENNLQITLEKIEQKLRTLQQNSFTMHEAIRAKESETNYKNLSFSIDILADELNGLHKTRM